MTVQVCENRDASVETRSESQNSNAKGLCTLCTYVIVVVKVKVGVLVNAAEK